MNITWECYILQVELRCKLLEMGQLMRLWYLSHRRPAKAQAIRAVSPEPSLFSQMWYGNKQRVRPKIRHLAHWMAAHARLKNVFTEDGNYHNHMTWLIFFSFIFFQLCYLLFLPNLSQVFRMVCSLWRRKHMTTFVIFKTLQELLGKCLDLL